MDIALCLCDKWARLRNFDTHLFVECLYHVLKIIPYTQKMRGEYSGAVAIDKDLVLMI